MGILFFAASLLLGYVLVRSLPFRLYRAEALAASTVIGLLVGTWIVCLPSFFVPYSLSIPWSIGFICGAIYLIAQYNVSKKRLLPFLEHGKGRRWWLGLTLFSVPFMYWLFSTHSLYPYPDGWYTNVNNWGDIALHMTLISHFSIQDKLVLDMPIYAGGKLNYPFLIDYLSSILYRSGWSFRMSLLVPGFLLVLSLVQLFYFTSLRLLKRPAGAVAGIFLFLSCSSFVGFTYFINDWLDSGKSFWQFYMAVKSDYGHIPEIALHNFNTILGFLIPQRGFLFGLPMFLIIVTLLYQIWQAEKGGGQRRLILIVGVLVGLLPFAHVHTFFVSALVCGVLAIAHSLKNRNVLAWWVGSAALAISLSLPQVAWQFMATYSEGFGRFQFGWMKPEDQNVLVFWLRNLGVLGVFLFANVYLIWRYLKDSFYLYLYLPLLALFLACNIYIFQPNIWDNTKFLLYAYLGASMFMGHFLAVWAKGKVRIGIAVAIVVVSCLSGYMSILQEQRNSYPVVSSGDIAFAEELKVLTPPDAVILTADRHNNPVPTLTGRSIPLGYRGWLWTYGINYRPVEEEVGQMFMGTEKAKELLVQYNISYVVIGPTELYDWRANKQFYLQNYQVVYDKNGTTVFGVR